MLVAWEAAMLDIKDRPGAISSQLMRRYFEEAVRQTAALAAHVPLDRVVKDGEFTEYMHPETQAMWVGFAIGMRCAERLSNAGVVGRVEGKAE
jgi:hypothetical protein